MPNAARGRPRSAGSPTAIHTQHSRVTQSACVSHAVKEFQDLNRAFAAQADSITVLCGLNGAVLLSESGHESGKFIDALPVVEKVVHHLVERALCHLLS